MTQFEQCFLGSAKRHFRENTTKEIDREQRRYEIAKDVLAAHLSNSNDRINSGTPQSFAKDAIELADALIEELKK